jgi:Fe(3+) dicitrate transport protein
MNLISRAALLAVLPLGIAAAARAEQAPGPESSEPFVVAPAEVVARRPEDRRAKLDHIMPEVAGTQITVTKKASVVKLDLQPTVIGDNQQQVFARVPGVLVSEQQTSSQYNFGYRGIGNPQESEYVLVLQDGLPISTDWIGFPTLYYAPMPQSVAEVQVIRGGSSLIYGPEPAPAINFVSRRPGAHAPLSAGTEQVGGEHGLYSTYNFVQGSSGPIEFRADLGYQRSDGQRDNAQSERWQSDFYLAYRLAERQLMYLDLKAYQLSAGNPGRINIQQFDADPSFSPTPYNHDWVDRYSATLGYSGEFDGGLLVEAKAWAAYQELDSRAAQALSPAGVPPLTTTVQDEVFRSLGADVRLRRRWGRGNAFTLGAVVYHDDAPFRQWTNPSLYADRDSRAGVPRLHQARTADYQAVFAENVFRFGNFHIVPSVRLDHETIEISETVRPPNLTRPLFVVRDDRTIPVWGLGFGNDFGRSNETYFSVSRGWRPLRFFDVASPFSNLQAGFDADPPTSIDWEAGVHGTPVTGLWYDVGLFWIDFKNRLESQVVGPGPTDVINVNTGDTRHRGFEGEIAYDFLASRGGSSHLTGFINLQLLDAEFTASRNPVQVGKTPAFAPGAILKAGLTWREEGRYSLSLTGVSVSSQYFQDSNLPATGATPSGTVVTVPAKIPGYTVFDIAGDYYITPKVRLIAGISNLGDHKYYSRVFQNGIEPAPGRTAYLGLGLGF